MRWTDRLRSRRFLLSIACVAALVGLAFMVVSVLWPRPIPVVAAMSVGQAVGTLSLLLFVVVVIMDMRGP